MSMASDKVNGNVRNLRRIGLGISLTKHLLLAALILGTWEAASRLGLVNDLLAPPPSSILGELFRMWFITGTVHWPFFVTLYESVAGFVIGVSLGTVLAVAAAMNKTFRRYFAPYVVVLYVTPGIAVTPLIVAWFGFGWNSKIALAALVCFFPPFINTLTGLLNLDDDCAELFRSLRASRTQVFWKLQLPSAMPFIMAGLKMALTMALLGAIVAEFSAASEGVGVLMQRFAFRLDMASALAALLTMSLIGLTFYMIAEIVDERVVFWRRPARLDAIGRKRRVKWNATMLGAH